MKIGFFLLVLGLTSVHATTFSQQKVNLDVKGKTLLQVLDILQEQSGYTFLFSSEDISDVSNLSVRAKNEDLFDVLKRCLQGTHLDFEVNGQLVILKFRAKTVEPEKKSVKIMGFVVDKQKIPMPGVTVKVLGTSLGTATNPEGWFQIVLPLTQGNLEFSFIGYKSKQVPFHEKNDTLRIVLEEELEVLEDVVVTGYYTQSKNSYTGAARTISAEELQRGGNQNILTALQNVDPSFVKLANNQMGSNPNSIPDFQIRGAGSISGVREEYSGNPNTPVFIVDGFETTAEKVFDMDPYRVASITLLKDAAATAIYGSRASNGVVVITTVAPASGKMSVSYNGDLTFYMADLSAYNLCNAREKLELEDLAGMYDVNKKKSYNQDKWSDDVVLQEAYNRRQGNIQSGVNTYWLDKPLNGVTLANKHSLRLDGGNDYIRYAMELNYNNTPGVMKKSGRERVGLGLELQYIYKNLTFREQLTYTRVKATNSPYGSFSEYTKMNPYEKYKDENGKLIYLVEENDRLVKAVRSADDNILLLSDKK